MLDLKYQQLSFSGNVQRIIQAYFLATNIVVTLVE